MKSLKKLENYIVSYDRFGASVGVNFKGGKSYKTRLGAFVSLASYLLVLINTIYLFIAFSDGSR